MKNERVKVFFKILFICFLFCLVSFFITFREFTNYKISVNGYLYKMVDTLKSKYPNITEQEIIEILNEENSKKYDETFLKYGIDSEDALLYQMELDYHKSILEHLLFTVSLFVVFLFFFFIYFYSKERKIKEITHYMQQINHKNYALDITENGEGELSILRNEVYKTTIMLREESELLKKEKLLLKDSISDISHQLKTPLTSILIMLDNILENPTMEEETRLDFIHNVYHQVENIHFLLVNLLKLSRLEANVVEFKQENINAYQLLNDVIENVCVLRDLKKIKLELNDCNSVCFTGDYKWEVEALTNILKNAIEHSKECGKVVLKVEENAMYVKIMVSDEGVGMSKKELKNIFKRFYKGENSASDSFGIGLNLAKNIIEKDGGLIKVDSKEGVGTTFEIRYMKK